MIVVFMVIQVVLCLLITSTIMEKPFSAVVKSLVGIWVTLTLWLGMGISGNLIASLLPLGAVNIREYPISMPVITLISCILLKGYFVRPTSLGSIWFNLNGIGSLTYILYLLGK